jgi:hypothetical protein
MLGQTMSQMMWKEFERTQEIGNDINGYTCTRVDGLTAQDLAGRAVGFISVSKDLSERTEGAVLRKCIEKSEHTRNPNGMQTQPRMLTSTIITVQKTLSLYVRSTSFLKKSNSEILAEKMATHSSTAADCKSRWYRRSSATFVGSWIRCRLA